MNDFTDAINRIAAEGEREYASVAEPGAGSAFVAEARRRHRTRVGARVAAGAAGAVALVVGIGAAVEWSADPVEPAVPVPGAVAWSDDVGAEMFGAPLVVDGRVYVGATDETVRAYELDSGDPAWTLDVGGDVRAAIVTDGALLFVASDDGFVYALRDGGDAAEVAWAARIADDGEVRSNPLDPFASAPVVAGDVVVVGSHDGTVRALDTATGAQRWSVQTRAVVRSTPATADGLVFIGSNDRKLYALDVVTGEEAWSYEFAGAVTASPLVADGLVIVGSRGTLVEALDATTGEPVWAFDMAPSWAESSPAVVGDVVVFGSSAAGQVYAVRLATGEPAWSSPASVGGWPWARPAATEDAVYVTAALVGEDADLPSAVFALDPDTGATLWRAGLGRSLLWQAPLPGGGAVAGPVVAGDVVIVAGLDGVLRAFWR